MQGFRFPQWCCRRSTSYIFRHVTSCGSQRFRGPQCRHLQGQPVREELRRAHTVTPVTLTPSCSTAVAQHFLEKTVTELAESCPSLQGSKCCKQWKITGRASKFCLPRVHQIVSNVYVAFEVRFCGCGCCHGLLTVVVSCVYLTALITLVKEGARRLQDAN